MTSTLLTRAATALVVGGMLILPAPVAGASAHTTCRVMVTDLGPTLRIVYTAQSPRPNRRYAVRIVVDGETVFRDRLRTNDVSRLRARVEVPDRPGRELIQGRARDLTNAAVCIATVRAPIA